ncbi:MAG: PAS domain S-box protein [Desulfomonilaceae bacterium]
MQDHEKTQDQLIDELNEMRRKVAELEAVQESLKESELRNREIVDKASEGIFVIQDGWIKFANKKATEITGYSTEEAIASTAITAFVHPDDQEKLAQNHARRLQGDESQYRYPFRFVRKDGTVGWVEMNSSLITWEGGPAALCLMVGITDRKMAEEALRTGKEKYRSLVESISDVIYEIDGRGAFTYISPVIRNVSGYEAEDLIGKTFLEFVHPEDSDLLIKRFSEITKGVEYPLEYRLVDKLGEVRYVRTYTKPIMKENTFVGARGTLIDITERKRWEEERLEMQHKLLQAQKVESLAVMAGGIAHDFNNQLAIVLGNLEMALMDLPPDSEAKASIQNAIEAAKRSAELSRKIQNYTGNVLFWPVELDLNELLNKELRQLKSSVSKNVTLNLEIGGKLPPIRADADQIQRLVTNIMVNASEAIGDNTGDVTLRTGVMDCDAQYLSRSRLEENPEPGRFVFLEILILVVAWTLRLSASSLIHSSQQSFGVVAWAWPKCWGQ